MSTYSLPGTVLRALHILIHLILPTTLGHGYHYYSHLTDKETKAQRSYVTHPRSHSLVKHYEKYQEEQAMGLRSRSWQSKKQLQQTHINSFHKHSPCKESHEYILSIQAQWMFISSVIQQIFVEHQLCVKHRARPLGDRVEQEKALTVQLTIEWAIETLTKQISTWSHLTWK